MAEHLTDKQKQLEQFATWLRQRYEAWAYENKPRSGRGLTASQTDFAYWLGVDKQMVSECMNGLRKPSPKNADIMAAKLGDEIYTVLGMPPRMPTDPEVAKMVRAFLRLSQKSREEIYQAILAKGQDGG